jgi:excisionase family DNA binding protein
MKPNITIKQFADALNVSRDTVERWVKAGKVKGSRKGPFPGRTSPILISASELDRVKKLQNAKA